MPIEPYINRLTNYIEQADYAGYDPYDALNSPLLNLLSCKSKWARIAFTQILRRLPINLRPVLGVRQSHNPKGIGLFLDGYSKLFVLEKRDEYLQRIEYLLSLLEGLISKGYSGNCWGYNFDWQNWVMLVPKNTPTIVNTSFIGHALLDCFEYTHNRRGLDLAVSVKDFILKNLNRKVEGNAFCFSYTPIDNNYVHNANLLGASILIRLKKYCQDGRLEDAAMASLAYSMKYQHDDGSWYYAEPEVQHWIDSFHSGFNLQALRYILNDGYGSEYQQGYEKGVQFYADNFFLSDGTPKYYHNEVYPIDIHAPAEAVYFFSGMGEEYRELTVKVLDWMLSNLLSPNGYFYFRKTKYFTNKISYMRWSQAWAFHALTSYLINSKQKI